MQVCKGNFVVRKSFASLLTKVIFLAIGCPFIVRGQEAGCFDGDTLYVKINTVSPPITPSTPNITGCSGSYTYQWMVSTDDESFTDIPGATGATLNYTQPITITLFFVRKSTCDGIVKYTNSVVVYPVYTACADFGLSLAGTSGNAVATIKADLVTTTTSSTIGEFVIEWYRGTIDDTPDFVSGSAGATDPAVTVTHPFLGEPAEGGIWHPVIKYIYIDGIKYSRKYIPGVRHSPDLLHCLDPIVVIVNNLSCSNGGSVFAGGIPYSHLVSYRNSLNSPTLANRSFRFDLDSVNKYFAWDFIGFLIADNIKITYVSPANGNAETVLEYWKVGSNAGGINITTPPKVNGFSSEAKIIPLTSFTYATGDYLRIEITPNANSNTDWDFYCKCLISPTCDMPMGTVRNITPGSVSMTYDAANCEYDVQYTLTNPYTGNFSSDFWRYQFKVSFTSSNPANGGETATIRKLPMRKRTNGTFTGTSFYGLGSCAAMSTSGTPPQQSSAQVSKVGNVVTLVFSNSLDYNSYKTNYNNALANANISNYSSDPTSINYYKFWVIEVVIGNSCGDALSRFPIWSHFSNPINFNDATKTITTTIAPVSNGYVPANGCDFIGQTTASLVSLNNVSAGNGNAFSGTTFVKGGIQCEYVSPLPVDETNKTFSVWYAIASADICDLSSKGWTTPAPSNTGQWALLLYNDRVVITNSSDPINNFRLERLMDISGNMSSTPTVIYEIVNGTVTVNRGFPN